MPVTPNRPTEENIHSLAEALNKLLHKEPFAAGADLAACGKGGKLLASSDVDTIQQRINLMLEKPEDLIKKTQRVLDFPDASSFVEIFDIQQQVIAATSFLESFTQRTTRSKKRAVVFGHKYQGKSQFLFFLVRLLQALGEGVVYLDPDISPRREEPPAVTNHWTSKPALDLKQNLDIWVDPFLHFLLTLRGSPAVSNTANKLSGFCGSLTNETRRHLFSLLHNTPNNPNGPESPPPSNTPLSFYEFHNELYKLAKTGVRIWVIADEATNIDSRFEVKWPEEQQTDHFYFVLTGSVGIASFVSKNHLEESVWDLPLFSKERMANLALRIAKQFNMADLIFDELDVTGHTTQGKMAKQQPDEDKLETDVATKIVLGRRLDELFGGIPGFVTEMLLHLLRNGGDSSSGYLTRLRGRVEDIVRKAAEKKTLSLNAVANDWVAEIRNPDNDWRMVRDAGLCGSSAPRGVILSFLLAMLARHQNTYDLLNLVSTLRSGFSNDPGLDGCLLELETIERWKRGETLSITRLERDGQSWSERGVYSILKGRPIIWSYSNSNTLVRVSAEDVKNDWNLVLVPAGFCVLDVLIGHTSNKTVTFYLVQVTRSSKPFAYHNTNETCSDRSKIKIRKLIAAARSAIAKEMEIRIVFVMHAPNTAGSGFVAPSHTSQYGFSPPLVVIAAAAAAAAGGTKRKQTAVFSVQTKKAK